MNAMSEQVQDTIYDEVLDVLDKLRPFLQRDGGDVELVDVEDGIVKLRLMGACGSCPSSTITLKAGIERALLEEVDGIVEVVQIRLCPRKQGTTALETNNTMGAYIARKE